MKTQIILIQIFFMTVLSILSQSISPPVSCEDDCTSEEIEKFEEFKRNFSKSYLTGDDVCLGRGYFCKNYRIIVEHNSNQDSSFKMSANANMDQPISGIRSTGHIQASMKEIAKRNATTAEILESGANMPKASSSVSQRMRGLPTEVNNGPLTGPIKDQGACGCCWTFCATTVIQYQALVYRNETLDLSEQEVVDCNDSSGSNSCNGGDPAVAFDYLYQKGVVPLIKYPFRQANGQCRKSSKMGSSYKSPWDVKISNPKGNVALLRKVIDEFGVVALGIGLTDSLVLYQSGIYNDPNCPTLKITHCVTLVGYGTDSNFGDYWILKNSWGTDWGEKGYFRLKSGVNVCGIETTHFYIPVPE